MIKKLKDLIFTKSFLLGVILTVGIFSKYIFGYNNLYEEVAELVYKIFTGIDVNFSHEEPEEPEKDLNILWPYHKTIMKEYK